MPQVEPSCPQFDYMMAEDRFPAMVAGFGAGKTEAAVLRCVMGKLAYPGLNRGFYEPTYDLVRMIAFPRFEEVLTTLGVPYKLYKSPLNYIHIPGYGHIYFRSMDAPARIIGYEHADADVDELDTLKAKDAADVWRRILSRNRQKKPDGKPNTIGVTTTPEGFRFVYQTWKQNPRPGYRIIQAPTESNPHLPDGYIDSLRDIYPEALLQAYLMGEFVNLTSGSVYHTFSRTLNNSDAVEQRGEHLHVGMDFNVQAMSAVIHVIRDGDPIAVGELTGVLDTPAMIELLKVRYQDHKLTIYPDASGKGRKTVDASTNDLALLRQAGFSVQVDNANPSVRDRVLAMCSAFCNAKGERKYRVNVKRCPEYTSCLEQQAYDKHGAPDKTQGLDHAPDGAGYFIHRMYPIHKPKVGMKRIGGLG
ncbi:terminase large subunit domain-containing protein [Vreelandella aquamarina]|uniref:terminase large subunit domain-containing protein n=1 Tax=Vreelandella aquamarina TaxID=77097 RepID=UPI003D00F45D